MFGARSKLDRGLDAFDRREWKRARRLLQDAIEEEPRAAGHYHLGLLYWRGLGGESDKRVAVEHFARAAEDGHPGAETAYGIALRSGAGVSKDNQLARQHFRSAAGAGDAEAMIQLATMSEPDDARHWLTRASESGYAPAMLHLSDFWINRDPVEALAWLYASVTLAGDDAARKRAAALAKEMTAQEIEEAQRLGRQYAKEIAERARGPR
ncbi:MAG TPA: tetratricopeptide repeat protein [Vitreimonas sp.]|uniref:tetratricopeptide repeat protein n=1 Tax=Vitreimonas sp. TaxID=3069702 RepID=UPI002D6D3B89|nr:tetratricopeptide repeat protein [Vitreimonas sp.]HYD86833.1 tetratricopeptide repeat protein [Vitreimonas sp.]